MAALCNFCDNSNHALYSFLIRTYNECDVDLLRRTLSPYGCWAIVAAHDCHVGMCCFPRWSSGRSRDGCNGWSDNRVVRSLQSSFWTFFFSLKVLIRHIESSASVRSKGPGVSWRIFVMWMKMPLSHILYWTLWRRQRRCPSPAPHLFTGWQWPIESSVNDMWRRLGRKWALCWDWSRALYSNKIKYPILFCPVNRNIVLFYHFLRVRYVISMLLHFSMSRTCSITMVITGDLNFVFRDCNCLHWPYFSHGFSVGFHPKLRNPTTWRVGWSTTYNQSLCEPWLYVLTVVNKPHCNFL